MKAAIYCRVSIDNQNVVAQFIGFASSVIAGSEIPRLRFGTGSAIWVGDREIGTPRQIGARSDDLANQPATKMKLIRASN
jgi:hypothetical protein